MYQISATAVLLGGSITIPNPVGGYSNNLVSVEVDNVSPYSLSISGVVNNSITIPPQTAALIQIQNLSGDLNIAVIEPPNGTNAASASSYVTGTWYVSGDKIPSGFPHLEITHQFRLNRSL